MSSLLHAEGLRLIKKYFPELRPEQWERLSLMGPVYAEWNEKINLVSRKDMDFFYIRHVLHSMAIYRLCPFLPGTQILDVGTGGGFPGVPLAICCPESHFLLVDSIGKKIRALREILVRLDLKNAEAMQSRAEQIDGTFDFVVSRAVTSLPVFHGWVKDKIRKQSAHPMSNGILYLKGGDIEDELAALRCPHDVMMLDGYFDEHYFQTKKLVHLYEL